MVSGSPTRVAAIDNLATPAEAPHTIRFSQANVAVFEHLRRMSFPNRVSMERGGTIVAEKATGRLSVQNIGGFGATTDSFRPNLVVKDNTTFRAVGTFHTHPYDASEGWINGMSFSGADIAHLVNNLLLISVVQSGPRLFAYVRTAQSPTSLNGAALHMAHSATVHAMADAGRTFQQSSRIAAQQAAGKHGLAYYQGSNGVVSRVHPA